MRTKDARSQMPTEFFDWLDEKEADLLLNDRQLSLSAGLASSVISKARSGIQAISWDACDRIARALNVPSETVFRLAGLLPTEKEFDPEIEEIMGLLEKLGEDDREDILKLLQTKAERLKKGKKK